MKIEEKKEEVKTVKWKDVSKGEVVKTPDGSYFYMKMQAGSGVNLSTGNYFMAGDMGGVNGDTEYIPVNAKVVVE